MGARGDDLLDFYRSDLGNARILALTNVSAQTPDAAGPLPPGRYILLIRAVAGQWAWVRTEPFVKTATVTAAVNTGFPLSPDGLLAVEFNVRKGHNDRIAGILEAAGSATLYILPLAKSAAR